MTRAHSTVLQPREQFKLVDGTVLRSLHDLAELLPQLSASTYAFHVTDQKNDFASWTQTTLQEPSLAAGLRLAHSQKQAATLAKDFVSRGTFVYESIIIGGGIAAVSAAIYASRKRMHFLMIGAEPLGQINVAGKIENYPGFAATDQFEFGKQLEAQLAANNIIPLLQKVTAVRKAGDLFEVATDTQDSITKYLTRTVIVCTGARARMLNVPGEEHFIHRGITYCAVCDGPLYKNKTVAVIGGGDSALEAAEFLLRIAKKIYIVTTNPSMQGHEYLLERVIGSPNVEVITSAKTVAVTGQRVLQSLAYEQNGEPHTLPIEGIFVAIGRVPNTDFLKEILALDKDGHVIVSKRMETNVPGIFAAGDCVDVHEYQLSIAAGQGVTALLAAAKYVGRIQNV